MYHVLSRQACLSLQDVAASQCVCSCGAATLSSPFFFLREWFFLLDGVNLLVLLKLMATQLLCFPLQSSFWLQAFPEDEVLDTGCSKLVAEHEGVVPHGQLRV